MSPLLLVLLPWAASPLAYLLRRWAPLAALVSLSAIALGLFQLQRSLLPEQGAILGRPLILEPASAAAVGMLLVLAAMISAYSGLVPQGWTLPAGLLIILGLTLASVMMSVLVLAVLLLELAALLAVFLIQAGRTGRTQAASHFFIVVLLATPPVLVGIRFLELHQLAPEGTTYLGGAVLFLAVGLGVLLAGLPFHVWLPGVADEAPPMATAVVLCILQPGFVFALAGVMARFPALAAEPRVLALLTWGGVLSATGGALLTLPRRRLGRLMAYSAVSGTGLILVGLGSGSDLGRAGALFAVASQALSLLLVAMGVGAYRHFLASDAIADLAGLLRRMPVTTVSMLIGGASLAGLPGTSGFVSRWLVYRAVYGSQPLVVLLLLVASGLLVVAYLRVLLQTATRDGGLTPPREPLPLAALTGLLALLVIGLGLAPGPVLEMVRHAGERFLALPQPIGLR